MIDVLKSMRMLTVAMVIGGGLTVGWAVDSKPLGEPADISYQEAVYIGVGGSYSLSRDAMGEPSARGTILLRSKWTDEYEAHETSLKFEYGLALRLESWKGKYQGMVFKTDFADPKLPTYVFLSTERSTMPSRRHYYATALWDAESGKWQPNESAIRATRK